METALTKEAIDMLQVTDKTLSHPVISTAVCHVQDSTTQA
jgi:hypothetical protein